MTGRTGQDEPAPVPGIFTGDFWIEAADRALKAAGYTLLAAWGGSWTELYALGWETTWRMTLGLVVISLVGSIVLAPVGRRGSAVTLPARRQRP